MCKVLTLCMAFLVTGNVMDNASGNEKVFITGLEFSMGFTLILWSFASYFIEIDQSPIVQKYLTHATQFLHFIGYLNYIVGGSILMITTV